jgi:hypothetical protein
MQHLQGVLVLISLATEFDQTSASKLRSWPGKDSFITGSEPISGLVVEAVGTNIFVFAGEHGSGDASPN